MPDVHYFPNEGPPSNLHTFFLRMVIRDDKGVILFNGLPRKTVSEICLVNFCKSLSLLLKVLHELCDIKFLFEMLKLEHVIDRYAKDESGIFSFLKHLCELLNPEHGIGGCAKDDSTVPCVELILMIVADGTTTDRDVRSTDDLVHLLKTLKSRNEDTLLVVPISFPSHLAKEKLDQMEGYAHICLGKFP